MKTRPPRPNESSPTDRALWEQVRASLREKRSAERAAAAEPLPANSPDLWLADSAFVLGELARIRGLALALPVRAIEGELPVRSVVDALWNLEVSLREILRLSRGMQDSWKATQMPPAATQAVGAVFGGNSSQA